MCPDTESIRPSSLARRSFSIKSFGRLIASFSVADIPWLYRSRDRRLNPIGAVGAVGVPAWPLCPGYLGRAVLPDTLGYGPAARKSLLSGLGTGAASKISLHSRGESAKQVVGTLGMRVIAPRRVRGDEALPVQEGTVTARAGRRGRRLDPPVAT